MPFTLTNTNNSGGFALSNVATQGSFALSTAAAVSVGGSISFAGTTTSRVVTSGSSDATLQFGTGSFTIEWWQRMSTGASSFPRVFEQSGGPMVSMEGSSASRTFYFWAGASFTSYGSLTSSLNETWNHFAVVRSGSASGNLKVFRNGTQLGSANTVTTNFAQTTPINVGNRTAGNLASEAYSGSITNFSWTKGVAKYTGSFTPTGPLTPISGSTGLLLLASTSPTAYVDSSGYNRTMIATASWTGSSPF